MWSPLGIEMPGRASVVIPNSSGRSMSSPLGIETVLSFHPYFFSKFVEMACGAREGLDTNKTRRYHVGNIWSCWLLSTNYLYSHTRPIATQGVMSRKVECVSGKSGDRALLVPDSERVGTRQGRFGPNCQQKRVTGCQNRLSSISPKQVGTRTLRNFA